MADVWIQVMTRSDADRAVLDRDVRHKMATEDAIGSEVLAATYPTQPSVRNDAALLYLELGRPSDALRHFSVVTKLEPDSAVAWYNEGVALEALKMQWVQYVPGYRTPAGTGTGMCFAYWM